MHRSKSWASAGGIAPTEQSKLIETKHDISNKESVQGGHEEEVCSQGQEDRGKPRMRQVTLKWPSNKEGEEKGGTEDGKKRKDTKEEDNGTWLKGGREEDNKRYRDFLKYCEDRREENRQRQQEDDSTKEKAKKRKDHWKLLRLCIEEIKENEGRWSTRKIEEVERIKEEEKKDRLAIAKEKKKRYGQRGEPKDEEKDRREDRAGPSKR